jgi:hypothetical protein
MTEEEIQKAENMTSRMLNEYGMGQLANFGIFKKLIQSLSTNDIASLVQYIHQLHRTKSNLI